jgi:adenine-specific DNA-methyltransferase
MAEILNLSRQTVSKMIKNDELKAIKMGSSYRIPPSELSKFPNMHTTLNEDYAEYSINTKEISLRYKGKRHIREALDQGELGSLAPVGSHNNMLSQQFILGDNLKVIQVLKEKLASKVDLIYIDPPYGTGQVFSDIESELAYSDMLVDAEFLEFLRIRLYVLRELLSERGSIYLHIDKKIGHYVKVLMDEIFGRENFINDITRIKCNPKNFFRNAYGNSTDMILYYAKKRDCQIWNDLKEVLTEDEEVKLFPKKNGNLRYTTTPLHAPGETLEGDTGQAWKGILPPKGRHWRYRREELDRLEKEGLIEWSSTGNPRKIVYAYESDGKKIQDFWEFKDKGLSYVEYPTQKNSDMLERIVANSSNKNSIVLDCFAGSGSTLIAASKLGRSWVGIDSSKKSFDIVKKLLKENNICCNFFKYTSKAI